MKALTITALSVRAYVRQRTESVMPGPYRFEPSGEFRRIPMDITVYSCGENELVVVPKCVQPSVEALSRFGPLMPCGSATVADTATTHSWARVMADMEQHTYAVVSLSDARRLLGSRHPTLRSRRRLRGSG